MSGETSSSKTALPPPISTRRIRSISVRGPELAAGDGGAPGSRAIIAIHAPVIRRAIQHRVQLSKLFLSRSHSDQIPAYDEKSSDFVSSRRRRTSRTSDQIWL